MDSKIELLIDAVERKNFLYNLSNHDYKNTKKKLQAWVEIAEEAGMTPDACKKKWKTLRDQFSRENGKRLLSGQAAESVEENGWKFFERLQFLRDHIKPRATTGNYDNNKVIADCTEETLSDIIEFDLSANSSFKKTNLSDATADESAMTQFSPSTSSTFRFPPSKKARKGANDIEKDLIATMQSIKSYIGGEEDEDDLFCASLVQKLKKNSAKGKNSIKVDLLRRLNEKEEELFLS